MTGSNLIGDAGFASPVEQRPWLLFARILLGAGWVVEATIGRFWKWGWFGSGVNPDWLGDTAGATITSTAERAQEDGVWSVYSWVLDNVVLTNAELWSWVTSITQVLIGLGLILGLFSRVAAVGGLAMLVSILLMGSFRTSPLLIALTLFVLLVGAERFASVDRRLEGGPLRSLTTLGLDRTVQRSAGWLAAGLLPLGVYFLLQQASRPAPRFMYVGQEMAVFCFAFVAAVVLIRRYGIDRITVAVGLLRMYVGYKLLWWVFTAPQAALTSLPGFNDGTALEEVLRSGAESHLPLVETIVEEIFAPGASFWAVAFGIVQVLVGLGLVLGWRVRMANLSAVALLSLYILLGFTRYAPYLAAMALLVLALGSAPGISVVRVVTGKTEAPGAVFSLNKGHAYGLLLAATVATVAAIASGITPNGYNNDVGSTVLWTAGLTLSLVAAAAVYAVFYNDDEAVIDLRSAPVETADRSAAPVPTPT